MAVFLAVSEIFGDK